MNAVIKEIYYYFRDFLKVIVVALVVFSIYVVIARFNYPLPAVEHSQQLYTSSTAQSSLRDRIDEYSSHHTGLTGIKVVSDSIEMFTILMNLVEKAEISIDAQYYMWHRDLTGVMLLNAISKAADRGVRVRLLLDDNAIGGLDQILAELHQHENIDVRIYNPFVFRANKMINFTFDFFRLNRRMHNKVLIVDGAIASSGSRNIGDEYFGTGEQAHFVDVDVLTVGEVMPSIVDNFNLFWQNNLAIPANVIIKKEPAQASYLAVALNEFKITQQHQNYQQALEKSTFSEQFNTGKMIEEWTQVTLIGDVPDKTLDQHQESELMIKSIRPEFENPKIKVDLITPYFIPGEHIDIFNQLAENDIPIRVLTNSFEATDSAAVHSGYARFRKQLLTSGVQLFEMKAQDQDSQNKSGLMSSGASSLHAKTFAVDNKLVFIGSFNFDPRSTFLNTEMGLLIESPRLAAKIHNYFDESIDKNTYQVILNSDKNIEWNEIKDNNERKTFHHDPNTSFVQRIGIMLAGLLPIKSLL